MADFEDTDVDFRDTKAAHAFAAQNGAQAVEDSWDSGERSSSASDVADCDHDVFFRISESAGVRAAESSLGTANDRQAAASDRIRASGSNLGPAREDSGGSSVKAGTFVALLRLNCNV